MEIFSEETCFKCRCREGMTVPYNLKRDSSRMGTVTFGRQFSHKI